jgi:hypothetical protein
MPAIFELTLPDEEPVGLIGPWKAEAAPVSFSVGEEAGSDAPTWKVSLPSDQIEADQALSEAEARIAQAEAALEKIPARLDEITASGPRGTGVSFAVASYGFEEQSPEAEMFGLLEQARQLEQGPAVAAYALGDVTFAAWEQARVQFETFVGQLQREVMHFAWVETNVEGRLLARTTVGWSGDSETVWLEGLGAGQVVLHQRSLQVTVKTRALRMRMFSTVTGGAAKLSVLLTTPAGALLALPAAWKYVTEILELLKTQRNLTQGESNG